MSCETQLIEAMYDWTNILNKGKGQIDVILLDFSKALDVVPVVVVVDPTPPTCCQQSPAPESCGSQQSLPPGGKERLHFVGIRPEVQARKGCW